MHEPEPKKPARPKFGRPLRNHRERTAAGFVAAGLSHVFLDRPGSFSAEFQTSTARLFET